MKMNFKRTGCFFLAIFLLGFLLVSSVNVYAVKLDYQYGVTFLIADGVRFKESGNCSLTLEVVSNPSPTPFMELSPGKIIEVRFPYDPKFKIGQVINSDVTLYFNDMYVGKPGKLEATYALNVDTISIVETNADCKDIPVSWQDIIRPRHVLFALICCAVFGLIAFSARSERSEASDQSGEDDSSEKG